MSEIYKIICEISKKLSWKRACLVVGLLNLPIYITKFGLRPAMVAFGDYLFFVPGGQDGVDPALKAPAWKATYTVIEK